ncbi:MAG: hypothetical protein ABIG20_02430 [archaeon]
MVLLTIFIYATTKKYSNVMYGLSASIYLILIAYILVKFDLNSGLIFLVLLASSGVMVIFGRDVKLGVRKSPKH